MNIKKILLNRAKQKQKTIIFPEANFSERIISAGKIIAQKNIAKVVFVGDENLQNHFNGTPNITVVNPSSFEQKEELAMAIYEKRKHKGLTLQEAKDLATDPIYFANGYVMLGQADGIVCGAEVSTAKTLKPSLQLLKGSGGLVSSFFLFVGKNKVTDDAFMMGDCAIVEYPTSEQLAQISTLMVSECKKLNLISPRVAFLSYSTMGSANSKESQNVRLAYEQFAKENPDVTAVGEVQFDASVLQNVAKVKMPKFKFEKPSNIFVMPNIDAGNIGYKMVQYFGGLTAIGPITMGFEKPVNDLSRGCSVQDIILVTAITCLQA